MGPHLVMLVDLKNNALDFTFLSQFKSMDLW